MPAPRRPAEAKEEALKKGGQTKDGEARVGKTRKVPQQPDKAAKSHPGATGPSGKSKTERTAQQMTRPTGKPKLGFRVQNPWSPRARMVQFSQPKGRLGAQGAGRRSKAKAAAAPKNGVSKTIPAPLARKTEVPKGPGRQGMPTKALSSNRTSKKKEVKN